MATYTLAAAFTAGTSGLVGTLQVAVYDVSGTALVSPTTSGITESSTIPGTYRAAIVMQDSWTTGGYIEWTVPGTGIAAADDWNPQLLQTIQQYPEGNAVGSIGEALEAARSEAFGSEALNPGSKTWTKFERDGVTPRKTFSVDSGTNPLSRT